MGIYDSDSDDETPRPNLFSHQSEITKLKEKDEKTSSYISSLDIKIKTLEKKVSQQQTKINELITKIDYLMAKLKSR